MARPIVWSIAGSDSGAGAGLQADLKAFEALDLHGCTAVAAITAQNSVSIERVEAVSTHLLDAQLAALASDMAPLAVKTGLLGSVENVRCVARWIDRLRRDRPLALVVDPVWRASTGATFASQEMRQVMLRELLPRATAITPNRQEAGWLLGQDLGPGSGSAAIESAAKALRALGTQAVVITGGDSGSTRSTDYLDSTGARGWISLPRVDTVHHHGSGCVFAASMAGALALDFCVADAAIIAKMSTTHALRCGSGAGRGSGPVRPQRGFALHREWLPSLNRSPVAIDQSFAPLEDRRLGLYAVVDSFAWVERVLAAGVRSVQLRIKSGTSEHVSREVLQSVKAAQAAKAQLFINDHWQLAIEHGAYGVHLGQEDLTAADLDGLQRAGLRIGLSTHSYWEVCRARALRPSYIACGPIYPTTTKDMPWRPQGAANLAYWCRVLSDPVVAIAGMDKQRSREAIRCGAAGVAVLRGITQALDPELAMRELKAAICEASRDKSIASPDLPRSTLSTFSL